ncbi:short chain dehydrogenase [Rhizobium tibeticum]|uniref:3-oxoacyl-[acyl-carrier-protein] reductase FabG n=1 Tax=Rhizobium tibeticum TaxID=501024 RepID=A0A1H8WMD7_9HYPH|nr:3-oxoacyl-[acyl-carrier-protein] reductase FabG [Rhizobium tibeticum]SEP28759.1 short chain dehydrogenase [Rhizobium tibeticum]
MFELNGRKALVAGASGAIGGAIARVLHAQCAVVGLHGARVEKLETLGAELEDRVKLFPANLANRDEVKALGQRAEADLEGVDILVSNAGITKDAARAHGRLRLGQCTGGQPHRHVPAYPRVHQANDAPPEWPDHQRQFGRGRHRLAVGDLACWRAAALSEAGATERLPGSVGRVHNATGIQVGKKET